MKVFYVGYYCDEKDFKSIFLKNNIPPPFASQKTEKMIIDGFSENDCEVFAVIQRPVPAFPRYKKIFISSKTINKDNITYKWNAILNVLVIKQLMSSIMLFFECLFWIIKNYRSKEKCIFVYSLSPEENLICILLSKIFSCKSVFYVSELPQLVEFHSQKTVLRKLLILLYREFGKHIIRWHDGYIMSSKYQNEHVGFYKKPYFVCGDLVDPNSISEIQVEEQENKKFKVMYSGGINTVNGIEELLNGFSGINVNNVELWLFGGGNCVELVKYAEKKDPRIRYFGSVPNTEVIRYQKMANLLINPRPSKGTNTRYSFPGKTVEYMLSGTPALITRLEGIPDEYYDYVLVIEREDANGIKDSILNAMNNQNLIDIGNRARKFVLENKSYKAQVKKMVDFIKKMTSNGYKEV